MTDHCIPIKLVFVFCTWVFTIFVCVYIREKSPELSRAQDSVVFGTWIVAVLGSFLFHNVIRVLIISVFIQQVIETN
jgi:hypothetical protein